MTERPTVSQAMIDAYDEYTHLTLDRRGFMDRLTKLAGSGAAAAAILPLIAADAAWASMIAADDGRLHTADIAWPGATGEMKGYLVSPADKMAKLPAVMVIHENRGLNEHIRDVARRLALEGFVTLAPDFLSPLGGTPTDEDKAREMIGQLKPEETAANAAATVKSLTVHPEITGAVGAIGFCWGGGLANRAAVASPELRAAVAYYGPQPKAEEVPAINAALLLHYAGLDERINAGIAAYEAALKADGKDYAIHVYEGANHAFNNDTSAARYNEAAAKLAWERTVAFLKAKLA